MKLKDQLSRLLEPLFLAMFMAWTFGVTIALLNPQAAREHQGVVEIYSLTAVTDANTGA
jgi:hypothetical protein